MLQHRLRVFAIDHDSLPAFHAGYLAVTVLIAALLNVGAFALLIVAHAALDLVKYHDIHRRSWHRTLLSTLRENLLDIFLLSGALFLAVYLHHGEGEIIAISGIVRAETSFLRGILLLIPRVEVLWNGVWVFANFRQHLLRSAEVTGPWRTKELLYGMGTVLSFFLIAVAPLLFDTNGVVKILADQLVPWKI